MVGQQSCAATAIRNSRLFWFAAIVGAVLTNHAPARAAEADTEHLFGFTEGADIGKVGERELEAETIVRAGKSAGSYTDVLQNLSAKIVPVENLRLSAQTSLAYFDIAGVPDLGDRRQAMLQGLSFEARYTVIDRQRAPFGLTLIAEPRWFRIDDSSGAPARVFGGLLTMAVDRELIAGRLFGAFNILYDSDATRPAAANVWQHQSKIGFATALALRLTPVLFAGGEVRYVRAYDGAGLDTIAGQAVFAGPTMYLQLPNHMALSGAWNMQISGRSATSGGPLDLSRFERHQAKLRLNYNF